ARVRLPWFRHFAMAGPARAARHAARGRAAPARGDREGAGAAGGARAPGAVGAHSGGQHARAVRRGDPRRYRALGQAGARTEDRAAMTRPNFIIVLIDDLRFDEFGAGGHPYMATPHVDRLAHEGAIFERAFHTTPICSPNRASIMT